VQPSPSLVEKRLLVAHLFGLCVAHMGCATIATPLVHIYQWRIPICATNDDLKIQKIQTKIKNRKKPFFLKIIKIKIM
jgi:hypothetical protein